MATVTKDFRVKAGLVVEGSTATVNGKNIITAGTVDAKGDLIVGSADDAVARLAVGTNGYVLTANSGATNGLEWAAPAAVGVFDTQITFEGATADAYETTLTVVDPTADRTITLPNVSGTVVTSGDTGTVTATMLAADSVTTAKILNSNVTAAKLASDSVETAKIVDANVTAAKLATDSVTTAKIVDSNVTAAKLASDSVTTAKILDANVTDAKLASNSVTNAKIADSAVDTAEIANSAVTTAKISDLNVTTGKLADSAVTTAKIADANVTEGKLASDSVTTAKVADSAITSAKIANDTIVNADINSAAAIDQSKISGLTTDLAAKLALTGGTMSGAIAMGTNKITGLGNPTNAQDAATKNYIDTLFGSTAAAAASAAAAATSASNALTSENNASSSASAASGSASAAAGSAAAAAASYDSFDDRYLGPKSSPPTVDNDGNPLLTGALYFDTTGNLMKVYTGTAWVNAGSSVNGTSERQVYTATASQTTFAATYDVGYVDVYLNGVKQQVSVDFVATNGTSVVFGVGLTAGDIVDIVAYGAFDIANVYTQTQSDARYLQKAGGTMTGSIVFAVGQTFAAASVTGLATVATSGAYSDLSGKPTIDTLLPSQSGNTGKYLSTNGSVSSWADVPPSFSNSKAYFYAGF